MAILSELTEELPQPLSHAISEGDVEGVLQYLENDDEIIHRRFGFTASSQGKSTQYVASLVGAVLRLKGKHQTQVLDTLIAKKASLQAHTTFRAGLNKLRWSGEPIHDAVAGGDVQLLKYLIKKNADICSRSRLEDREGATTLWQAAYYGHADVIQFLLKNDAAKEIEVASPWQDKQEEFLTPLHVAARVGNTEVVQELLVAKAQFDSLTLLQQGGSSPLQDAIERSHVKVVKLLVANGATVPRRLLFEQNNEVAIAAVARGLRDAPASSVQKCLHPIHWLFLFLMTPGKAPLQISSAIFRVRQLKYFDRDSLRRCHAKIAEFQGDFNVAEGCDYQVFENSNNNREPLSEEGDALLSGLGLDMEGDYSHIKSSSGDEVQGYNERETEEEMSGRIFKARPSTTQVGELGRPFMTYENHIGTAKASADIVQCIVPNLLSSEHVLFALAFTPNTEIFDDLGCRAVVRLAYGEAWGSVLHVTVRSLSSALLFAAVTGLLGEKNTSPVLKHMLSSVLLVLQIASFGGEALEMVGMRQIGRLKLYLTSLETWADWTRIVLSFTMIACLLADEIAWEDPSVEFRTLMATTALFRWVRVLSCLRAYELIGPNVEAIFAACQSVGAFLLVVFFMMCGFIHSYKALGLGTFGVSMMHIYRLGFLADLEPGVWNNAPDPQRLYATQALMLMVGLVMTVVMMNIFIGILSESYHSAFRTQHRRFLLTQARVGLKWHVKALARASLYNWFCRRCCCCRCCRRSRRVHDAPPTQRLGPKYLWHCRPTERTDSREKRILHMEDDLTVVKQHVEELSKKLAGP